MTDATNSYAKAIVALASGEGVLDTVEDELLSVARSIDGDSELRGMLTDIHTPAAQRLGLIETKALVGAHPVTRAALAMVIAGDKMGAIGEIATSVAGRAAEGRNEELAEVYVASALSDDTTKQLQMALEKATGKSLSMKVFVDPDVIGGVRARIGDTVIDGSLSGRLNEVRGRLRA